MIMGALIVTQLSFGVKAGAQELNESDYKNGTLPSLKEYKKEADKVWTPKQETRIFVVENEAFELNKDVVLKDAANFAKELNVVTNKKVDLNNVVFGNKSLVKNGDIVLELLGKQSTNSIEEKRMVEEGYTINVDDVVTVKANSNIGIFYGQRTILQSLKSKGNLMYGNIKDFPDVSERAFHIDIARKYYTKDWIIQRIKDMSWMKLNTVQIHFSENEGFRLESKVHPEVMSSQYITQEEMKEIIQVAKDNKVKIIPSFDTPGHLKQALKTHPEFQLPTRYSGKESKALDITNPDARKFVKDLYKEFAELFKDSTDFHIGGDEFIDFDRTRNYPILTEYAQNKYGSTGTWYDTYIEFTNEISNYVKELGFVPRVWNDAHYRIGAAHQPNLELNKDIIITYWTSWHKNMASLKTFLEKGHKVINYNDSKFYYVLGEAAGYTYPTAGKIYNSSWHPGQFPWRNKAADSVNYKQDMEYPYSEQLLGVSYAIWSDRPNAQTEEEVAKGIYLALREMAETTYNSQNRKDYSFQQFQNTVNTLGNSLDYNNEVSSLPTGKPIQVKVVKSKLDELVKKAKEINNELYTEESIKNLSEAIFDAEKILNDNSVTQEKVDEVASILEKAMDNLKEKVVENTKDENTTKLEDTKIQKNDNAVQNGNSILPKTGDDDLKIYLMIVAAISVIGIVILRKNKKQSLQ